MRRSEGETGTETCNSPGELASCSRVTRKLSRFLHHSGAVTLNNLNRLFQKRIILRRNLPRRRRSSLLQIVQRRHIVSSFLHGRRNALSRNRFSSRRIVIRNRQNQGRSIIELNHALPGSGAKSAITDRLAAMIIRKRSSKNFRRASRPVR